MKKLITSRENSKFENLSKDELIAFVECYEKSLDIYKREFGRLHKRIDTYEQELGYTQQDRLRLEDQIVQLKRELFGPSSEKQKKKKVRKKKKKGKQKPRVQVPSEKHPDLSIGRNRRQ